VNKGLNYDICKIHFPNFNSIKKKIGGITFRATLVLRKKRSFETSGNSHPETWCHIPEDLKLQQSLTVLRQAPVLTCKFTAFGTASLYIREPTYSYVNGNRYIQDRLETTIHPSCSESFFFHFLASNRMHFLVTRSSLQQSHKNPFPPPPPFICNA
jgi:hypothetical protein